MRKHGFTMLEILVVLAVLAILIGTALPRVKGMQDLATVSKIKAELKQVKTAVETYYLNRIPHVFPASTPTLIGDVLLAEPNPVTSSPPLRDPFGATATTEYNYLLSGNGMYYVIYSRGLGSNGSASISNAGVASPINGAYCATNGTGCE
jgi:prepilin-type N-terminal cleavage/methylation domain-containing protein